jgi:lipopolysaccharide export LptBFGC system permease protein LptF
MGKTLFWYIFKDLLKVFLLASGAIAGIMSFAGLLRPLSQHSLALGQVLEMLGYFMPAMTNYSWPIAALFATTFVYGRLSADNELTACRAAGIPYWMLMLPAGVLGLIVAGLSLFFLFFVVPHSFMKAEHVVYSNLAQFVANRIERTQQIIFDAADQKMTVFARGADVLQPNPDLLTRQAVQLRDVVIVTYRKDTPKDEPIVPQEFYIAREATALIDMPTKPEGDVMLTALLKDGAKVPRDTTDGGSGAVQALIQAQSFGPFPLPSPVRETTRFMDFHRLQELRLDPGKGKRVAGNLKELTRTDQHLKFVNDLEAQIKSGDRTLRFVSGGEEYVITAGPRPPVNRGGRLVIVSGDANNPGIRVVAKSRIDPFEALVRQVTLQAFADTDSNVMSIQMELKDAVLFMGDSRMQRQDLERRFAVPMPPSVADLTKTSVEDYLTKPWISKERKDRLRSDLTRQKNQVESELHGRVSFALSCLVLVLVGSTIGMLFKSGNFVSAFAVSTAPALLSIVLVVTGQHMSENVPKVLPDGFENPLKLGLQLIWGGNAFVSLVGFVLFVKLSRT